MRENRLTEESICIREIEERDIELIRNWRNQDKIRQYFLNQNYITEQQQQEWFQMYKQKKDDKMFIIEKSGAKNTRIGAFAFYYIDLHKHTAEFGRLMIGEESFVGKGFGKQAVILACKYAFEQLNIEEIYVYILTHNTKVIQLHKDIGFVIEKKNGNENTTYMVIKKQYGINLS
ncbi:GNAT family N-acetyltransferase [Bacillus sp. FSL K6-0268]|uniref:GNAT family N-acetyltransferase n=1 Tax=Bacillus sp. FSL K6-0268 TaxID=2921449 RepID=UPI0030F5AE12